MFWYITNKILRVSLHEYDNCTTSLLSQNSQNLVKLYIYTNQVPNLFNQVCSIKTWVTNVFRCKAFLKTVPVHPCDYMSWMDIYNWYMLELPYQFQIRGNDYWLKQFRKQLYNNYHMSILSLLLEGKLLSNYIHICHRLTSSLKGRLAISAISQ